MLAFPATTERKIPYFVLSFVAILGCALRHGWTARSLPIPLGIGLDRFEIEAKPHLRARRTLRQPAPPQEQ
jgi:hypothetical protein